jgi:hypothetical protein
MAALVEAQELQAIDEGKLKHGRYGSKTSN